MQLNTFLRFLVLLIFSGAISYCSRPQGSSNESSTDTYRSFQAEQSAQFFSIPPRMASLFIDDTQVGAQQLKAILSKLNQLSFLIVPNGPMDDRNEHYNELIARLQAIDFISLTTLNSESEQISVLTFQPFEEVEEVVVLFSDPHNLYCVSFTGNINLAEISEFAQPRNIGVLSSLNELIRW